MMTPSLLRALLTLAILCPAAAVPSGCAGGQCSVRSSSADYPISLSKALFGKQGQVIIPDQKQVVKNLSLGWKNWTLFWTLLPLNGRDRDVTAALQKEIKDAGGNGITELTITAREDWFWYFSSLVPIWPTFVDVTLKGKIVRVN